MLSANVSHLAGLSASGYRSNCPGAVPLKENVDSLSGEEHENAALAGYLRRQRGGVGQSDSSAAESAHAATNGLVRSKIKGMNFLRGYMLPNQIVIPDEARNLTTKRMKTLITRAGPGTKIVRPGKVAQIDTPYLTEGSSRLTYAIDRLKRCPNRGDVMLALRKRSLLADFAFEVL